MKCARSIDGPVAVIGDVHGQLDLLDSILTKLKTLPDYHDRWIVLIGDLVDRGPNSRGVIDRMIELSRDHGKVTSVMGNHELAMGFATGLFDAPEYSDWDTRWCDYYGADATFASYNAEFPSCEALREALPQEHVELLTNLPWSIEHPEFFFVHAGLDPNQPFEMQRRILEERDFSLSRPPWLCSKDFANEKVPSDCDRTVVSGHVPLPEVHSWAQRILIDTTGGVEGDLSCVLLPERILISSADEQPPVEPAENQKAAEGKSDTGRRRIPEPTRRNKKSRATESVGSDREIAEEPVIRPKWYEFWK